MHEWDPSVLDYSHPEADEEPVWSSDPQHIDLIDPNFDTMGSIPGEPSIHCHPWLMNSINPSWLHLHSCPSLKPTSMMSSQKHMIMTYTDLTLDE